MHEVRSMQPSLNRERVAQREVRKEFFEKRGRGRAEILNGNANDGHLYDCNIALGVRDGRIGVFRRFIYPVKNELRD